MSDLEVERERRRALAERTDAQAAVMGLAEDGSVLSEDELLERLAQWVATVSEGKPE